MSSVWSSVLRMLKGSRGARAPLEPLSILSTLDHTELMLQLLFGVSINEGLYDSDVIT